MAKDWLEGVADEYDVVVIGSGLGGLTAANTLGKMGRRVLVVEHHYQFGGLATWFKRPGRHIFDISLHGFPVGMKKSLRRYWNADIAGRIRQVERVRFINPQFDVETSFTREDFTRIFVEKFGVPREQVVAFYDHLAHMNYYDNDARTTKEMFEQFFPGRNDVHRLLMEPITYANGSSWDDPAITYGIVFSNFMSKGVYIYQGGTDDMIQRMQEELASHGVELRKNVLAKQVEVTRNGTGPRVSGIWLQPRGGEPRFVKCRAVVSNSNVKNTIFELTGAQHFDPQYVQEAEAVRVNSSSCQVYMGIRRGETIPDIGELVFTSKAETFSSDEVMSFKTSSRTFSVYYPETRPQSADPRYAVVASLNAKWEDWADLDDAEYAAAKQRLCDEAVAGLEKFIPDVRSKIDHLEAATPRTMKHYVRHFGGTSFGTKFEGLKVSMDLPEQSPGLSHAGSVGIIMSGWLGTINYGVIVANKLDSWLGQG
ncbi:MAG: phytoene desaturase family protein [Opitutales bacterium]